MVKNKIEFNFLGFNHSFAEANLILFGAPFDGTASFRPGSRFGPNAIRSYSEGLETYSPYFDQDLSDYYLCDLGDLPFQTGDAEKYLQLIENQAREIFAANKKPLMLGGEHLVTLPAIKAAKEKYPNLRLLHFDAHTDLRNDYLGEKYSHATVIRRCWEILGDHNIYQYGIRSGEKAEFDWAKKHTYLTPFTTQGVEKISSVLKDCPVYITLDLDILDPSVFPGTGTPEPGGITFNELIHVILKLKELNIVGADINELAPHYDLSGVSTMVACKMVRELTLAMLHS
ncbi:agmatinase [Bacillota bacterium LX-D]|nr:agmatinase [Bacillota bacterium LX-D]